MHEKFLSFGEARYYVRELKLKNTKDWEKFCYSGNKPDIIPGFPHLVYQKEWRGWDDWLRGSNSYFELMPKVKKGNLHQNRKSLKTESKYTSFEQAREFVHKLNLKKIKDWENFCAHGYLPEHIPTNPGVIYQKHWEGWQDWLVGNQDEFILEDSGESAKVLQKLQNTGEQKSTYLSFEKAKEFIHSLKLKSESDWWDYASSGNKPHDIPFAPWKEYSKDWSGFQDWIGIETHRTSNFLPFEQARDYVRKIGLKSANEWYRFRISGDKPSNIPSSPNAAYKEEWKGWGDWLGTGRIDTRKIKYLPFEQARDYVRKIGLRDYKQWTTYCKSGNKPHGIPNYPNQKYAKEWKGWRDWFQKSSIGELPAVELHSLDSDLTSSLDSAIDEIGSKFMPFEQAREFVRLMKLKGQKEWNDFCKSGKKPSNIPSSPHHIYKEKWKGYRDWLGIPESNFLPFEEARNYVRSLGLNSSNEWTKFLKSGRRPHNIPSNPDLTYKEKFQGYGDWLGTGKTRSTRSNQLSFEEARNHVKSLGLINYFEWTTYCKSGNKPPGIPSSPDKAYWEKWKGWQDWLGLSDFLPFHHAKSHVRALKLKDPMAWSRFCESGMKPGNIPSEPWRVYANEWKDWDDWLGIISSTHKKYLSFEESRKYVRSLKLSPDGWFGFCMSGRKPGNIPSNPAKTYRKEWISLKDWLGI